VGSTSSVSRAETGAGAEVDEEADLGSVAAATSSGVNIMEVSRGSAEAEEAAEAAAEAE
jgi:hypothetical protein